MKRFSWLLVAAALLGLAAWLMSRGDKPKRADREAEVVFPRYQRGEERIRNERRKTLPPARPKNPDAASPQPTPKRDPLLVALPTDKKKSTVVFEIAGLRDSPVGKAWLDCLMRRDGKRGLDKFQKEFGINPIEDIERVAVSSAPLMILSVPGDKLKFDEAGFSKRTFGSQGAIYEKPPSNEAFATWGGLVLTGPNAKMVEEAIARLESNEPVDPPIPEWSQYGDIYGSISPHELSNMMPDGQEGLAAKIKEAVQRVDLHVDASNDVAMVADVEGPGQADIEDLGKSFGAALSLARLNAQSENEEKLAELLDYAAVHPHGNRFSLDVALPFDLLKEMGPCRKGRDDTEDVNDDAGAP